jgi:nitronate monooxygenase
MISTRLTERFGIRHPIVCAPMAWVTGGALAAAVSHAGGPNPFNVVFLGTVVGTK